MSTQEVSCSSSTWLPVGSCFVLARASFDNSENSKPPAMGRPCIACAVAVAGGAARHPRRPAAQARRVAKASSSPRNQGRQALSLEAREPGSSLTSSFVTTMRACALLLVLASAAAFAPAARTARSTVSMIQRGPKKAAAPAAKVRARSLENAREGRSARASRRAPHARGVERAARSFGPDPPLVCALAL